MACLDRQDPLRGVGFLDRAVHVTHGDQRRTALILNVDAVFHGFSRILTAKESTEEVLLLDLLAQIGVEIADQVIALRAVTIFHREACRIDGHAYTAPCAIERFRQHQRSAIRCSLYGWTSVGLLGLCDLG